LLPTPGANDHKGSSKVGQREFQLDEFAENLPDWIRCPCCDCYLCVVHWPLHAHECDCLPLDEREPAHSTMDPYSEASPGRLSTDLSEWLMGWPLGWTDCAAPATDRFHEWLHWHGRP
jgi:hypothetical protein